MYSFNGDFRRKPQQNLAGASRRDEKAALLQHAHLERLKREQQRGRHNATVKIQALVRSFITRQAVKGQERYEFDKLQKEIGGKHVTVDELMPFIKKILFFYSHKLDGNRLVWLLQHVLKLHKEIKLLYASSAEWLWRIRWILTICMQYSLETVLANSVQSIAIPLRILEVFTTPEDTERVIRGHSNLHLKEIFAYLVTYKYFEQVKELIDAKVPCNLEPSSTPPTPVATWFLEMIQRPLSIVNRIDNSNDFNSLILNKFCTSILSQKLTDQLSAFLIPALAEFKEFPYDKLINCINNNDTQPTISLLYCVLHLEPVGYSPGRSKVSLINYLQVLASLSSSINPPASEHSSRDSHNHDESGSDSDTDMPESQEAETIRQCIGMLNEEQRVQGLLLAVDATDDPTVMQPLCRLCHNLLVTNKHAIHKYKLLYMLAFKPAFLRQLWSRLLAVSQTSLFGGSTPYLHIISRGIALSAEDTNRIVPLLAVFCSLFSLLIATLHDNEFFIEPAGVEVTVNNPDRQQQAMPFTTYDLAILSSHLKGVCLRLVELAFPDTRLSVRDDYKNALLDHLNLFPQHRKILRCGHTFSRSCI